MANPVYQYRVVIHVLEDDEWADQELIPDKEFDTHDEAAAERDSLDLSRYSKGTYAYVEERMFTDWSVSDG